MVYIFYVSTCANITPTPEVVEQKKFRQHLDKKKEPSKKILTQLAHIPIFFCQVRSSSRGEDLRDQRLGACPGT